jgi:outer membrane lipoprotein-sorting protein
MLKHIPLFLSALSGAALLSGTAYFAAPVTARAQASNATLASVQAHLRAVDSMTADFTQTDRRGQVLAGKMILKKPGKIRFEYQKGIPHLIVGDGKAITFIDYSARQVSRWPIGNTPLAALIDPNKDLSRFGKINATTDPNVLSISVKDVKKPEYGEITMIFIRDAASPGGLMLRGWVALDSKNNRTTIRLSNQKFNVVVAEKSFNWTDPRRSPATGR